MGIPVRSPPPMGEIAAERTKGLAQLAVHLGANVAPGQDVVILAYDIEHAARDDWRR